MGSGCLVCVCLCPCLCLPLVSSVPQRVFVFGLLTGVWLRLCLCRNVLLMANTLDTNKQDQQVFFSPSSNAMPSMPWGGLVRDGASKPNQTKPNQANPSLPFRLLSRLGLVRSLAFIYCQGCGVGDAIVIGSCNDMVINQGAGHDWKHCLALDWPEVRE